MSGQNSSSLACLEVAEKFVVVVVVGHLATMSSLNPSYLELLSAELSRVRVGF